MLRPQESNRILTEEHLANFINRYGCWQNLTVDNIRQVLPNRNSTALNTLKKGINLNSIHSRYYGFGSRKFGNNSNSLITNGECSLFDAVYFKLDVNSFPRTTNGKFYRVAELNGANTITYDNCAFTYNVKNTRANSDLLRVFNSENSLCVCVKKWIDNGGDRSEFILVHSYFETRLQRTIVNVYPLKYESSSNPTTIRNSVNKMEGMIFLCGVFATNHFNLNRNCFTTPRDLLDERFRHLNKLTTFRNLREQNRIKRNFYEDDVLIYNYRHDKLNHTESVSSTAYLLNTPAIDSSTTLTKQYFKFIDNGN